MGGSIVVVETDEHKLAGSLPDGKPAEAIIHVIRPHTLVLLKLLAMYDRYQNVRGATQAERDREEARTHVGDIVSVMSLQRNLGDFRKVFGAQFDKNLALKARIYQIIRDCFSDDGSPGLVLYRESLAVDLPHGESVRELGAELHRAQRLISSLIFEW